jgi:dTDP-4-amino-4,6-dideoxygalactose transaminase
MGMLRPARHIPFNKPCIEGKEIENILNALNCGKLAGNGDFGKACEKEIEAAIGAQRVLLTNSGTAALELSALLCGIQPGDEVIMPSFTFVSTANAFCLRGAKPVFVDVARKDLNMDCSLIESAITRRTKAIVPVHYAGVSCDMEAIAALAERHGLRVVEDAAHGYLATHHGRALGTFGDLGCFSFHETKTFMCGEGGAIAINRDRYIASAEIMREKGTDRERFFRGEVEKYTWMDLGSSFLPSELAAAFLYGQLLESRNIVTKRKAILNYYNEALRPLAEGGFIETPWIPEHCAINYYMYYILVQDSDTRFNLLEYLNQLGISAVFHFVPLHESPFARRLGIDVRLPVTEDVASRIVRLPLYNCMTPDEQQYVVEHIFRFFKMQYTHAANEQSPADIKRTDQSLPESECSCATSEKGSRMSRPGAL